MDITNWVTAYIPNTLSQRKYEGVLVVRLDVRLYRILTGEETKAESIVRSYHRDKDQQSPSFKRNRK